jgi:hypothetical protein
MTKAIVIIAITSARNRPLGASPSSIADLSDNCGANRIYVRILKRDPQRSKSPRWPSKQRLVGGGFCARGLHA